MRENVDDDHNTCRTSQKQSRKQTRLRFTIPAVYKCGVTRKVGKGCFLFLFQREKKKNTRTHKQDTPKPESKIGCAMRDRLMEFTNGPLRPFKIKFRFSLLMHLLHHTWLPLRTAQKFCGFDHELLRYQRTACRQKSTHCTVSRYAQRGAMVMQPNQYFTSTQMYSTTYLPSASHHQANERRCKSNLRLGNDDRRRTVEVAISHHQQNSKDKPCRLHK